MQDKAALRQRVLADRAALTAAERASAGEALAAALLPLLRTARRVASYVAVGTEPPTASLTGVRGDLLLPVLLPDGDLDWAVAGGLTAGPRGLREPSGPRLGVDAVASCDLVLVPALAVD